MRIHRRGARAAAFSLLILLAAGCTPSPVTVEAASVRTLYDVFLVAAAVVFVIVAGLIGWSIVRYRDRGTGELPVQTASNLTVEIIWWALPTLLVIFLFILSAQVLGKVDHTAPDPQVSVKVEGFQWQWRFTYEGQNVVITGTATKPPELVLPVGETIHFDLQSDDVIHSFYIPRFLIKRDVIPGVHNHIDLTIDQAGTYSGQCAEFCGLYHDEMLFSIRAVPPAEFASWLAQQPRTSP
jgi:cytochrome c oxidase subunit II